MKPIIIGHKFKFTATDRRRRIKRYKKFSCPVKAFIYFSNLRQCPGLPHKFSLAAAVLFDNTTIGHDSKPIGVGPRRRVICLYVLVHRCYTKRGKESVSGVSSFSSLHFVLLFPCPLDSHLPFISSFTSLFSLLTTKFEELVLCGL